MLKNLKYYLNKAKENKFALGQFNFCTLEQLKGISSASKEVRAPIVCGTSGGEIDFIGMEEAIALVHIIRRRMNIPVFLNLDHGKDLSIIKKAVDLGYDSVHFDGSALSFEKNIELTKKVVSYAKKRGVLVEGEVAKIEGRSIFNEEKSHTPILTSMEKIVRFTKHTRVDSIALDVGTLHGVYSDSPKIHFERIDRAVKETDSFVVLHGGSGVTDNDTKEAIRRGAVKININTDLRIAWRDALHKKMIDDPKEVIPYNILPAVEDAVRLKTKEKIILFGSKI